VSPESSSDATRSLSLARWPAVSGAMGGGWTTEEPSPPDPHPPRTRTAKATEITSPAALIFPVDINRESPVLSAITLGSGLETAAARHRKARVTREVRVRLGAPAEGELGSSGVADQALMPAAITEAGVGTGHRSLGESGGSSATPAEPP